MSAIPGHAASLVGRSLPPGDNRSELLQVIRHWIDRKPGFRARDYPDVKSLWKAERIAQRDYRDAQILLDYIEHQTSITASDLIDALKQAGGRLKVLERERDIGLQLVESAEESFQLGYRRAVCEVLAYAIKRNLSLFLQFPDRDAVKALSKRFKRGLLDRWFSTK